MNLIGQSGFLTKDAEVRTTANGNTVYNFRIGINNNKDKAFFVSVEAWENVVRGMAPYLLKGKGVDVVGELSIETWEDKEGKERQTVKIKAFNIGFLTGGQKKDQEETETQPEVKPKTSAGKVVSGKKTGKVPTAPVAVAVETETDEEEDSEIPF